MSILESNSIKLRDYQVECINSTYDSFFESDRVLNVLPCGAGKTVIFEHLILKIIEKKPDIKVVILFNRVKLLKQIFERISKSIKGVGIYCASLNRYDDTNILVASVHSLPPNRFFNLIIVDECHNINDESGKYKNFITESIKINTKLKMVGFTATPYRNDGYIFGEGKFWPKINYKKDLVYFINKKYLVNPVSKQPDFLLDTSKLRVTAGEYNQKDINELTSDREYLREQVIDALNRSIDRKKMVWFCSNIEHAENVEKELRSFGEYAVTIHSNLEDEDQDESLKLFTENQDVRHMTFVSMVSEGFDYPPIDCIVLLRPTRSASLYVQTCGRALRLSEGKENALILDYAQVVKELGPLTNPLVNQKRSGEGKAKKKAEIQKVCPRCKTFNHVRVKECTECKFEFPVTVKGNLFADENADLLGNKIESLDVSWISISPFTSKKGNRCIKVSYYSKNLFQQPISEYFAFETEKGKKNLHIRSAELKFGKEMKAERIPKRIYFKMVNGYPQITTLMFDDEKEKPI